MLINTHEAERARVQTFIDVHRTCGEIQPSTWRRHDGVVALTQRCVCGATQAAVFDGRVQVELTDGTVVAIDAAPHMADVWQIRAAAGEA